MILIGKVIKTRSNKGEVSVMISPYFNLDSIESGKYLILKSSKHEKRLEVDYLKEIQGRTVIKFKEITGIQEALRLVGYEIHADEKLELQKGMDWLGFDVRDLEGQYWGTIIKIETGSHHSTLIIQKDDKEILVPLVADIIVEAHITEKQLIIDPPEGLIDLNS